MKAVARYVTAPATLIGDIGDLLSERQALEKSMNRKISLSILSNILYLLSVTGFAIKRILNLLIKEGYQIINVKFGSVKPH